ncbi:MAG: archaetidylserine decarboxylase [Peptococcaceae bacterium]|nr:archaetidylserine decarboxylase [Peptococcaceae bacterium]
MTNIDCEGKLTLDEITLLILKILPRKALSRLVGALARSSLSKPLIAVFAKWYTIDVQEAELEFAQYTDLTAFFVRRLRPGLRPIAPGATVLTSPVDGIISESGPIVDGKLIQAKGVFYSVLELLGNDQAAADTFSDGIFVTIYLSPQDYHRIHVPLDAKIQGASYVPGTLFPVNPFGVRAVQGLFARNERLITYLESVAGVVALVKVGAIIVGSIKVNYAEFATSRSVSKITRWAPKQQLSVVKGEEIGHFEFGSTVILLFQHQRVKLQVVAGERVRCGQAIGRLCDTPNPTS